MKKLEQLKPGAFFCYGGVQWIVLENDEKLAATLAIAAAPVFNRAFDDDSRDDWRKSSLRLVLNGSFFDTLIQRGANRAAFLEWESDLTADDGMTNYGTATDKIALPTDKLYRKFRQYIPAADELCWTLTPRTCNPKYNAFVRAVDSSGALNSYRADCGKGGVRPLCYLESSIFVSVPYEEECADPHAEMIEDARDAVLETLTDYPADVWGDAIAAAVASLFQHRREAEEIALEEAATRALLLAPGMAFDLTGATKITVKIEGQAVSAGTIIATAFITLIAWKRRFITGFIGATCS